LPRGLFELFDILFRPGGNPLKQLLRCLCHKSSIAPPSSVAVLHPRLALASSAAVAELMTSFVVRIFPGR
jgi:hypothetical protein